jgi:hypothetical protein
MAAYIGVCVDGNFTHGMAHTLQNACKENKTASKGQDWYQI